MLFDAISIGSTAATVADDGAYAAHEAADDLGETKDLQKAFDAATAAAVERNPRTSSPPRASPSTRRHRAPDDQPHRHDDDRLRWGRTAKWATWTHATAKGRSVS